MEKVGFLKFYHQYKIILFPILVAISSFILIFFVIYPQLSKLISNNNKLSEINQKVSALGVKAEALNQVNQNEIKGNLDLALSALPLDKDYSNAISSVQALASQLGFNVISVDVIASTVNTTGPTYPGFSLRAEIVGPADLLNKLLIDIENSFRVMKVSSLEVNPSRSGEVVTALVTVNVFYSPPPKTLGEIATPLPEFSKRDQELISTLARSSEGVAGTSGTLGVPRGKSNPFE